jgi:hypothetical protein
MEQAAVRVMRFGSDMQTLPVVIILEVPDSSELLVAGKRIVAFFAGAAGVLIKVAQYSHGGDTSMSLAQA